MSYFITGLSFFPIWMLCAAAGHSGTGFVLGAGTVAVLWGFQRLIEWWGP